MEDSTNDLADRVTQYTTKAAALSAASIGYRVLSSIVGDYEITSPAASSALKLCNNEKNEGLGGNNKNATKATSILSTNWFWSSNTVSPRQYSASGFDKESGLPIFTLQDVSFHDMPNDCWVVLYDRVYDITTFLNSHPGGDEVMLEYAGHDATLAFRSVGHSEEAEESLKPYLIGILAENERIWTRFGNMKSDVP